MIERLYVNNFRCFENFSIDFAGRPSALIIGKNGSGKSTLRKAFEVLQRICRGANRVKDLILESDFAQGRKDIPLRFDVQLSLDSKRYKYVIAFEFPANFDEARVAEESLDVDGNLVFSRKQGEVNQPGGSSFILDWHLAGLYAINIRDRVGENLRQRLRSYFASMILIAPIPAEMKGFSEKESVELTDDASNFSAWLNALLLRYPRAYNFIDGYIRPMIPDLASFENVPRGEKGKQLIVRFEHGETNRGLSIDFKHLSDGEKCFFLSALIAASNKVAGPVFCMWDEPDNHLSLPEIGHFITQLRKLTNDKGQFIATSHHPETIRRFSDENTLVFTRRSHLEPTVVQPLTDFQYRGDLVDALIRDEVIG